MLMFFLHFRRDINNKHQVPDALGAAFWWFAVWWTFFFDGNATDLCFITLLCSSAPSLALVGCRLGCQMSDTARLLPFCEDLIYCSATKVPCSFSTLFELQKLCHTNPK